LIRLRHLFAGTLLCLLPIHVRAQQAPDVAPRLLSNDPKVRADAEGGLVNGAARSLPSLRRLLERGDDNLTLRHVRRHPADRSAAIPLLVDLLRHERVDVRRTAIDCLIDLAPETEAIQPSLRRALRDGDSDVAGDAARALGALGAKAAPSVPALVATLSHEDAYVRVYAAEALARSDRWRARPRRDLARAVERSDPGVRWAAARRCPASARRSVRGAAADPRR
jgi:hypothetical protein